MLLPHRFKAACGIHDNHMQQACHTNNIVKLENKKHLTAACGPPEVELLPIPHLTKVLGVLTLISLSPYSH